MRLLLSTSAIVVAAALIGAPTSSQALFSLHLPGCCNRPMQPPPMPMKPIHWGGSWGGGHSWGGGSPGGWGHGHGWGAGHGWGMAGHSWGMGHGWGNGGHVGWSGGSWNHGSWNHGSWSHGSWSHGSWGGSSWGGGSWGGGSWGSHTPPGTHAMGMHYYGMSGGSLAARYGKIERFGRPFALVGFPKVVYVSKPGAWHAGWSKPSHRPDSWRFSYRSHGARYGHRFSASYHSYWHRSYGGNTPKPAPMPSSGGHRWGGSSSYD